MLRVKNKHEENLRNIDENIGRKLESEYSEK
jgi:hypothetical protein